ncbi:MAG: hypothetical protein P1V35_15100 [Planctomycetota bacterium]|nr:hypothetical protein [Planctomycetota bacterium]
MFHSTVLPALIFLLTPAQDGAEPQQAVTQDRWQAELQAIDAEHRPGLEFLLEHMPPADRANLSTELVVENVEYAYKAWKEAPWHKSVS